MVVKQCKFVGKIRSVIFPRESVSELFQGIFSGFGVSHSYHENATLGLSWLSVNKNSKIATYVPRPPNAHVVRVHVDLFLRTLVESLNVKISGATNSGVHFSMEFKWRFKSSGLTFHILDILLSFHMFGLEIGHFILTKYQYFEKLFSRSANFWPPSWFLSTRGI